MTRHTSSQSKSARAVDENINTILLWERAALHQRSPAERASDRITRTAGSGRMLVLHIAWFATWILVNTGSIPGVPIFDKFPFPLLTMAVSLEAIFLSLFVLASENSLTHQSEKRAHLDLQINMLAEREMTAVLVLLHDLVRHLDVKTSLSPDTLRDLTEKTDIERLTRKLEDIPEDE
jgi:uncharacterized membrane protein